MLTNPIESIRIENAKFARNIEYIKETALDDQIDERLELAESEYYPESIEEMEEAAAMVNRLPEDEDPVEESAEIDRILNATENITFEEMANI